MNIYGRGKIKSRRSKELRLNRKGNYSWMPIPIYRRVDVENSEVWQLFWGPIARSLFYIENKML